MVQHMARELEHDSFTSMVSEEMKWSLAPTHIDYANLVLPANLA